MKQIMKPKQWDTEWKKLKKNNNNEGEESTRVKAGALRSREKRSHRSRSGSADLRAHLGEGIELVILIEGRGTEIMEVETHDV